MIESPQNWPMWPVLPLKKSVVGETWPMMGVITPDYPATIIHLNMFEIDRIKLVIHQLDNDGDVNAEGVKTTTYTDVDAMLDDGWMVD